MKVEEPDYLCSSAQHNEWEEWILMESKHRSVVIPTSNTYRSLSYVFPVIRTFTLLYIINMLFDINPSCDPSACNAISAIPLPAYKSLWEATTYVEWREAHTASLEKRADRPNLTYGNIIRLLQECQMSKNPSLGDLNDWFLNLDAFGTFVLMTATSF